MKLVTVPSPVTVGVSVKGRVEDKPVSFFDFLKLLVDVTPSFGQGVKNRLRAAKFYRQVAAWMEKNPATVRLEDADCERFIEADEAHNWGAEAGVAFIPFSEALRAAQEEKGPAGE